MNAMTYTARTVGLGGAMLLVAIAAMLVAVRFAESSVKMQVVILGALAGAAFLLATRQLLPMLLFGWIMLLTYNRQYYSFDGIYGDYGSQGLYWIPADAALICMLLVWVYDAATQHRDVRLLQPPMPWYVPFLIAAGVSALVGEHMAWGAAEWLRWVKLAVTVALLSHYLRGILWWVCVGAFAIAVLAQSGLGAIQVALNSSTGLLSMVTGGSAEGGAVVAALGEGGRTRASGTMAHPNILAPYLLYLAPLFLALALGARDWRVRVPAIVACLASYVGLVGTMSRLPIALVMIETALLVAVLLGMRLIALKHILALGAFAGVAGIIVVVAFLDPIAARLTGDLKESFDLRTKYNDIAIAMWQDKPIWGVGLNHFTGHVPEHSPQLAEVIADSDDSRKKVGLRVLAPVHNLYLLVLSETGAVGLLAFLILLFGALYTGIRASLRTSGSLQLAAVGLTVGLVGQCLQQTMDFSMWMDPGLVTFSVVFCLLASALRGFAPQEPFPHAYTLIPLPQRAPGIRQGEFHA